MYAHEKYFAFFILKDNATIGVCAQFFQVKCLVRHSTSISW